MFEVGHDFQRLTGEEWCFEDECPASICYGPHRAVETTFGIELLREDQSPIGTPIEEDP